MDDAGNRVFIHHVPSLFAPDLLLALRAQLITLEKDGRLTQNISEREARAIKRGESSDALRMQDCWYDVWRQPVSHTALLDTLRPFTWVTFPVQVRHVRTVSHAVPWHQDAGYMNLQRPERRHRTVITCFVPIEPEPWKHTTVQFCSDNKEQPDEFLDHDSMAGFGAGLHGDNYRELFHYDLRLGDALLFGDLALHRTFTPPGACVERRSLEFRLIQPLDALPEKDYFDVERQMFVRQDGTTRKVMHG